MKTDVVIVGGGLLGSLLAWRLARSGTRVRLFEQAAEETPVAAAHTAAAMIAPYSERPLCHPEVFELGCRSLDLWPQLIHDLLQDTGIAVTYRTQGSLLVAHPADEAELQQFEQQLRHHHLQSHSAVQAICGDQLRTLEPDLAAHFERGYWLTEEAQVDNRTLIPALHLAAREAGAALHFLSPLSHIDGRWYSNDGDIDAQLVIDTRGVGARRELSGLRGVRGETLWVECPQIDIRRPVRLLHPRYHLYLVPRGEGRYQLGATEIESEDRSPVSVRSAMEMLSALWTLVPEMAEARILSMETNLRPAMTDHLPVIRYQGERTLQINGLFRHGYLLAPALLEWAQQDFGLNLGIGQVSLHKESSWIAC